MGVPDVPRWMRDAKPGAVAARAQQLTEAAGAVDKAGIRLADVLAESAGVLGWQSDGALAARRRLTRADGQAGRFRDLLDEAAEGLRGLDRKIGEHRDELRKLLFRWYAGDPLEARDERRIEEITGDLALADRTARDALQTVSAQLRTLGLADHEDDWVGSAVPPGPGRLLGRYDVVEDAAERALLDKVMLLPDGPRGDADLRDLLAGMSPEDVADFLARHPDVARRLAGGGLSQAGTYPPGSPENKLADAMQRSAGLPPKERIALVRAAFATMTPAERQRLALLYPGVVGNLDGAPLDARMAANHVKIGVALDDRRTVRAGYDSLPWYNLGKKAGTERNDKRIDYYEKLLYEDVPNPTYVPSGSRERFQPHQVLVFDDAGDGRFAEMWGTLDKHTRNVAVFVPGTGTNMENVDGASQKMYDIANQDPSYGTVTITWMGTDLPDGVASDAPFNHYAEAGGPALRDFVWGVDAPDAVRTTAIGHSYGGAVVGVADRSGLEVDQVLHVESAGAGKGVNSTADYPAGRNITRYSMTAPGDPIEHSQGVHVGRLGHGADPDTLDGVVRLDTGRYAWYDFKHLGGGMLQGGGAHSDAVGARGSTAWQNIYGVVTGGEVTLYTPRRRIAELPYEDPDFEGPRVDIE